MPEAIRLRGVHLDLKGAPLPIDVLVDEIRQMAGWGINLLLVEYEDTFPYAFDKSVRAATAYSPADIERLRATCSRLNVEVVPLVQTFGHLEFVLKHKAYSHLAQTAGSFASIDPTLPESRQLVIRMIDELLAAHPGIRWLHLGGDEVWDLGKEGRSKARVEQIGKDGLYLEHMIPIIEHVLAKGVRPILWDDMMREWPMKSLEALAPKVDLMPWSYGANPFEWLDRKALEKFQQAGIRLWAAGAFKGADGSIVDLPNDGVRMSNMEAWAKYVVEHKWEGMVATGWTRYNGLMSYCELWQAAPMSVYLAGSVMRKGRYEAGDWEAACRETIGVSGLPVDWTTVRGGPRKALEAVSGTSPNKRLRQLMAIAAIVQWRNEVQGHLPNGWLAHGHFEDPGRYNQLGVSRSRKRAEELRDAWGKISREFEEAIGQDLWPEDVRDYMASRRRMGMCYLQAVLA